MMSRKQAGLVAMGATLMVLAAACTDVKKTGGQAGGGGANVAQCGSDPISIAVNAWVGAEANAAVARP